MATSTFNWWLQAVSTDGYKQFQMIATSGLNWWLQVLSTDGYKHFQLMATHVWTHHVCHVIF